MITLEKTFQERLNALFKAKLEELKQQREDENKKIVADNKETKKRRKESIYAISGIVLKKKKHAYTKDELLASINKHADRKISMQMFRKYLKGESYPPIDIIYDLANYFQVSFEYLAGVSTAKHAQTDRIEEFFNLDKNAIHTLLKLNHYPDALKIMNALLTDCNSLMIHLANISLNIETRAVYNRRLEKSKDISEYTKSVDELSMHRLSSLNDFYQYIEQHYLANNSEEIDILTKNALLQAQYEIEPCDTILSEPDTFATATPIEDKNN